MRDLMFELKGVPPDAVVTINGKAVTSLRMSYNQLTNKVEIEIKCPE
jgi:hypothetical protein